MAGAKSVLDQPDRAQAPPASLHPLVLVTTKDADHARALKDVLLEEVLWLGEISSKLRPAAQRLARGVSLGRYPLSEDDTEVTAEEFGQECEEGSS